MDHDSMAGAKEFIEAGNIMGITTTIGFELRTDWNNTPFKNARINNPDQLGCAYVCIHGVPHQNIDKADSFLSKIRAARNERNQDMVKSINDEIDGINLDFEKDVFAISNYKHGGSITERHILYALGKKIIKKTETRNELIKYLGKYLKIQLTDEQSRDLRDKSNLIYEYDLLNVLKSNFIQRIYIDAKASEILPVDEVVSFAHEIGAIPAYAYLGDIGSSITRDKKPQKFEDGYVDELITYNKNIGFEAVAYMPSRNTGKQLERIIGLCEKHELMQINGEDINQPRQSFICKQLKDKQYGHLVDNTWALIGHELKASQDVSNGLFAEKNKDKKLEDKIGEYASYGKSLRLDL